MKKIITLSLMVILSHACSSTRKMSTDQLYGPTWELEYISGIRIAFEGLFPDKKPVISFDKDGHKVSGNNSCNGYSADFEINGNQISFGQPGPTTMMYCGQGESQFLNTMEKINTFGFDAAGKLLLMVDEVVMMRFKKL